MNIVPGYKSSAAPGGSNYAFLFAGDKLVLRQAGSGFEIALLTGKELAGFDPSNLQYLGMMDNLPCFAGDAAESAVREHPGFITARLFELFGKADEGLFRAAGTAYQLAVWMRNAQFCGRCGSPLKNHESDRARECASCGYVLYPRISPAVIVAVVRDRKILLARAKRFRSPFYSVLAGYVEAGESAEECVKREVMEETKIGLKNIRYFTSQPWPFPDSLMLAFTAEYESGEISIDEKEITEAGWYDAQTLPAIPGSVSVARKLIDWFISVYG